jgi:hypothetical protein
LEELARGVEAACAAAMQLLDGSPDLQSRLHHIDPVPASTRAILRRLVSGGNA